MEETELCPIHNTPLSVAHLGPDDMPLCKACHDSELGYRLGQGFEDPADEVLRREG